ncbi:MAG TPA: hypothetical protein VLY04_01515, partial [Bryobacteraceae bacterium]|nr:hypothetical protein [Bryobacteraceae bacterium]
LVNLVRYHRAAHGMYRRAVEELNLEPRLRAAVNISDPFHFDWRIVLTATFWFGLYTGALTILSFVTLWRGVWWK